MADIFYNVLIIWVLWQIFGRSRTHVIHHHQYSQPKSKDGEVRISQQNTTQKTKSKDEGEYVDFEEVK